ncbi:type I-E CRISPR-associated protein Cas5/CasD [Salinifilum ghardaiensis]
MTTRTMALRIDAPMQSWGSRSKFIIRDTEREPTKSGIVGLLAAARGIARDDEAISKLAALRMGVRVDREGLVERDFHTAQDVPNTDGKGHRTVVSHRYYLADALFLVALEGEEDMLAELERAVRAPRWPLFFGRKAFVPARPLVAAADRRSTEGTGCFARPLEDVLRAHPWLETRADQRREAADDPDAHLRTVVDTAVTDPAAEPRHDHPESFDRRDRRYATRAVRTGEVPVPSDSTMELVDVPE